jgi:hypothetical protein
VVESLKIALQLVQGKKCQNTYYAGSVLAPVTLRLHPSFVQVEQVNSAHTGSLEQQI